MKVTLNVSLFLDLSYPGCKLILDPSYPEYNLIFRPKLLGI